MLRRAVELDPSSYDSLFALAELLLCLGRLVEVGPLAERMASLDPLRPEAGQIRAQLGGQRPHTR